MKTNYLPTTICSLGEAFFLILIQISIVNIVLLELNIDVNEDIRAANMTANIIPRAPDNIWNIRSLLLKAAVLKSKTGRVKWHLNFYDREAPIFTRV